MKKSCGPFSFSFLHQNRIAWLNDFVDALLFESCFLSHSTQDKTFCQRLSQDLKANGVACWYFPESAAWEQSVWDEINRGIPMYDRLLLVCSVYSLTSGPVLREMKQRGRGPGGDDVGGIRRRLPNQTRIAPCGIGPMSFE